MDEVSNRVLADRCRWVASLCAVDGELALDGLRLVAIARSPGGDEPELGAADLSHLARGPFLYLAQLSAPQALREAGVDPAAAVQCLIRDCLGTGLLHGNGQPEQQSDQFVPRHTWVFGTWSDLQGSTLDRIEEDARAVHAHLVAWNTADAAAEPLAQVLSKDPGESPYPTADKILCVSLVRLS